MKRFMEFANFNKYTLQDEPVKQPLGTLVEGSRDVDLFRVYGNVAKRRGIEAQNTRINLAIDGDFEDALDVLASGSPWTTLGTFGSGDSVAKVTEFGSKCLKVVCASGSAFLGTWQRIYGWKTGERIKVTADINITQRTSGMFRLELNAYDAGMNSIAQQTSSLSETTNGFVSRSVEMAIPSNAAIIYVALVGHTAVLTAYVDNVVTEITKGSREIKSVHNFRKQSGDIPLLAVDTLLCRLSGDRLTMTKTTTADFDEGTKSNTVAVNNDLKLVMTGTEAQGPTQENTATSTLLTGLELGQTFKAAYKSISAISVYIESFATGKQITLRLWNGAAKQTLLGTATKDSGYGWVKFTFSDPIALTVGDTYFYTVTCLSDHYPYVHRSTNNVYADGAMYVDGIGQSYDMAFRIHGSNKFFDNGKWTSPAYDLSTTPASNILTHNSTIPGNAQLTFRARGSEEGLVWGDWQEGLPLARFVQIEISFTTDGTTTPIVHDFTITRETAYTTAKAIRTGLTGNRVRFTDYRDVCYIADGGRPRRYDGINVRNVGVDPPSAAPSLAATGTGLTGTFAYRYTFVNEYGAESNGGPTAQITLSNQSVALSSVAVGPAGTTARNIYRTKAGGTAFFYVGALNNNTDTTYNDSTSDANLITPLVTDNNIPPNADLIHEHKNYMLYSSGRNVFFSKPGLPDCVPPTSFKAFPGTVTGMYSYEDALIVCGNSFTYAVLGDIFDKDPATDDTVLRIISGQYGALSREGMEECFSLDGNILAFPTRVGIQYITPGLQENSLRSIPLSRAIQKIFDQARNKDKISIKFHNNKAYVSLCYDGFGWPVNYNNIIEVYDFFTKEWNPPWHINANGFFESRGRIYFGSSTTGRIFELEKGTSDDGTSISATAILAETETPRTPFRMDRPKYAQVEVTENSVTDTLEIVGQINNLSALIQPGPVSGWKGLLSPKKLGRFKLSGSGRKGNIFKAVIRDVSKNDWIIRKLYVRF